MNYNSLKITLFTLFLMFFALFSKAQSNYFKWSYGFGVGPNYSKTDVAKGNWGYTIAGNIDHHFTPFVTGGLEVQYGMVQGGDIVTDPNNWQFVNKYTGINANIKIALGEFVNYKKTNFLYKIRGLYGGFGLGVIKNNITDIVRYKPIWAASDPVDGPFLGRDKSLELWVPINLGINFYFNDKWGAIRYALNLNAQSNFTFGEGLDGYNNSASSKNYTPDTYNAYTIGFRYYLGNTKIYRRTL